ncbi:MAG: hypothetical protein CM1200mP29_13700 [Verrucomicrobiota bacterium]|nr:MAG: hypothetical protein CM1200mP29_13700 [Verrucomicrobiota bacterium]
MKTIRVIILFAWRWPGGLVHAEFRAGIACGLSRPNRSSGIWGVGPSSPVTKKKRGSHGAGVGSRERGTRVAFVSTDFLGFPAVLGTVCGER